MASDPAWKPKMAAPSSPAVGPRDASASPSPLATATNPRASRQAWPRSARLLRRAEFRAAYEQGMRRSSPHFTLFALARPGAPARFGITASAKVGNAVVRNRLRRRTRALLRQLRTSAPAGFDIVINPRPKVATAAFPLLAAELGRQLQLLGPR